MTIPSNNRTQDSAAPPRRSGSASRGPVAISIPGDGHRVALKWHKLRRVAGDPPWSVANLRAGLAAGASLEVDVRALGDGAWVCLHDDKLDEETDGRGPVSALDAAALAKLKVRGSSQAPLLLTAVAREISVTNVKEGCVQLDLKEQRERLSREVVESFVSDIAPVAPHCLLSGTDWEAVRILGRAVPSLRLGFDPLDLAERRSFEDKLSFADFFREVLAAAPHAAAFYIHYRLILGALAAGLNPIPLLKSNGATVDAWTLDPTTPGIREVLAKIVTAGVDQITTNDPTGLAEVC